ncbi:serine O-acetyltransferase EpsC [Adhaeribacter aquaticus]|uniref:serine O-acetyltransferase EpsC n=1 Tax=Adhaeribacter aquaticus TaxID=299567 RepID=UPI000413BE6B|nr:serine O-acetyltransferase EpsC [Adhaeribacter aquaticus]
MKEQFAKQLFAAHAQAGTAVPKSAICKFTEDILHLFFPQLAEQKFTSERDVLLHIDLLTNNLIKILSGMPLPEKAVPELLSSTFTAQLPFIYQLLLKDAEAIANEDPAALNIDEVIRTYPGFWAIAVHRVAHALHLLHIPLLPRILSEMAHNKTGIDIHPGAQIGSYFCIDHGTGIVIGETSIIGDHVKIYQGVTLGAMSVAKEMAKIKRHPTIEDHVVIYAGATILGGNTVVGSNSVIGGNVWLTESVPPYSRLYHKAQIKVSRSEDPEDSIIFSI